MAAILDVAVNPGIKKISNSRHLNNRLTMFAGGHYRGLNSGLPQLTELCNRTGKYFDALGFQGLIKQLILAIPQTINSLPVGWVVGIPLRQFNTAGF